MSGKWLLDMDLSVILIPIAAGMSLLANSLKVWEFASPRLSSLFKTPFPYAYRHRR